MLSMFLSLSGFWASAAAIALVYGIDAALTKIRADKHPAGKTGCCKQGV